MLYDPKWEEKIGVKLEPWQEILLKAADLIEKKGWVRGRLENYGRHCAIGALMAADGYVTLNISQRQIAMDRLSSQIKQKSDPDLIRRKGCSHDMSPRSSIIVWNDEIAKSGKQVVTAMRKAAHVV